MRTFLFRLTLLAVTILLSSEKIKAADGCYITSGVAEPRIYYIPINGVPSPPRFFSDAIFYRLSCPPGSNASTEYAIQTGTPNVTPFRCYAGYSGSGSTTHSGNYRLNGAPISFRTVYCPLDDYLPHLMVVVSCLGFIAISKRG